jgi:hypothetical protein
MNIDIKEIKITLTGGELFELGWHIACSLKASIKDHYNHLQQNKDGEPIFYEQEKVTIHRMNKFLESSGHSHMIETFDGQFKELFEKRRAERKKDTP